MEDIQSQLKNKGFFAEFFEFLKTKKRYWLIPIVIILALLGGLIVLTEGSAVAPFVYTLF